MMRKESGQMSGRSAIARADESFEVIGQRIGLFAALTRQRIQQAIVTARAEADAMDHVQAKAHKSTNSDAVNNDRIQPALLRAEAVVDSTSKQLSNISKRALFQAQRFGAYLQEDIEDILVEAQHLRQQAKK